jgi:hypothetical protein
MATSKMPVLIKNKTTGNPKRASPENKY